MLRDVLILQKREIEQRLQEHYVERDVSEGHPSSDLIHVILGPRRAGKSFYAMQRVHRLGLFGYVNFDDERLRVLDDYDALIAALDEIYKKPKYLLLDEIQNLPRWELFVNRLQRGGYFLTLTGSNAHLLSSELSTHLTGRHRQIVIFPFSFNEYLRVKGDELTDPEKGEAFRSYLESGGYPEPLLKPVARRDYLSTLLRSTLYKDIVVRHRIRSPQGLDDLASYLMSNVAQEFSSNALLKVVNFKSVHTIEKYLKHLEEAFLFFAVRRFSFKVKEQVRSQRKIYCIDNGLVTSTSFRFSQDLGKLFENLVAVTLRKAQLEGKLDLYFWKNTRQEEVDFVVKRGLHVAELIQVCLEMERPKTKDREIRSLLKASEALNCDNLVVLTENLEKKEHVTWGRLQGEVQYIPMKKWLSKGNFG